jgi:AcrR family transcriptional regulator
VSRDEAQERFKAELKEQSKAFADEVKQQSKRFAEGVRDSHDQFHAHEHAAKPRRRRGKGPRSAEEIVATAVHLADTEGFDAVTMRRVAAELGYGTMTLYWYVENRDELVRLMFDEVIAEQLLPEPVPDDWREGLRAIAHASRRLHERHRWVFVHHGLRPGPGPNLLRHIDQSMAVTASLAGHPELRATAVRTVDEYVLGHLASDAARGTGPTSDGEWLEQLLPAMQAEVAQGRLLHLRDALSDAATVEDFMSDHFDHGLELVLDGIQAQLDRAGG